MSDQHDAVCDHCDLPLEVKYIVPPPDPRIRGSVYCIRAPAEMGLTERRQWRLDPNHLERKEMIPGGEAEMLARIVEMTVCHCSEGAP